MTKNDILERIRAGNRRAAEAKLEAGDVLADIRLFEAPWHAQRLGDVVTGKRLGRLADRIIDGGRLRHVTEDGEAIEWIHGEHMVRDLFLQAVRSANGRCWAVFKSAYDAVHSEIKALDPGATRQKGRGFDLFDHQRVGNVIVGTHIQDAWTSAFSEGRILVAGASDHGWEFQPPHLWTDDPPFQLQPLRDFRADQEASPEWSAIRHCVLPDFPRFLQSRDLTLSKLAPQPRRAYLISGSLPRSVLESGQGPKNKEDQTRQNAASDWLAGFCRSASALGKRPSKEGLTTFLSQKFRISKKRAAVVFETVVPESWKRSGRIPAEKKILMNDFITINPIAPYS